MPRAYEDWSPLFEAFVKPFYLDLLHANFVNRPELATAQSQDIAKAATSISDTQVQQLLETREWRGRLTAAWFVGLTKRARFIDPIGDLLLASQMTYAGQGYCVALGLIGGADSERHLRRYLQIYLPVRDRIYDQTWAIGALAHVTNKAPEDFLDPALWQTGMGRQLDPNDGIREFTHLATYLDSHDMIYC